MMMFFAFIQNLMLISLLVCSPSLQAQEILPTDERGRIVFYEIVEADSFTQEELLDNARQFARELDVSSHFFGPA